MSFVKNIRTRRVTSKANRALDIAIKTAGSPGMRDELLIASQRAGLR